MKKLFSLSFVAALLIAVFLPSCTPDNGMDEALSIFQQYEVVMASDSSVTACANFRLGTAAGDRLELTNGSSIFCNALEMFYRESTSPTEPEFNYYAVLPKHHKKAIFTFNRTPKIKLVNEISFDLIPMIGLPSVKEMHLGETFKVDLKGVNVSNVNIRLIPVNSTSSESYSPMISPTGDVTLDAAMITPGRYDIVADTQIIQPTTQNDNGAGGSITLVKRAILRSVTIY